MSKSKNIVRLYVLMLIFMSIEYLGQGNLSVFRLIIFPMSCMCLLLSYDLPRYPQYRIVSVIMTLFLLWLSFCQLQTDNNPLFPVFTIPLVLSVVNVIFWVDCPPINYSIIFSLYSIPHIMTFLKGNYNSSEGRFCGLHVDPNFCALFLCIAILGSILYLIDKNNSSKFIKSCMIINLVLSGGLVFLTGSRGALLVFVMLALLIFYTIKRINILFKILVTIVGMYLFSNLMEYINSLPSWVNPNVSVVDSILCRFQQNNMEGGSHRTYLWEVSFNEMFSNNAYFNPIGSYQAMRNTTNSYPHNLYIDFMLEMGMVMGSLFDIIIGVSMIKTLVYLSNSKNIDQFFVLGLVSLTLLIQLFFLSAYSQKFSWMFVTLLLCVTQRVKQKNSIVQEK